MSRPQGDESAAQKSPAGTLALALPVHAWLVHGISNSDTFLPGATAVRTAPQSARAAMPQDAGVQGGPAAPALHNGNGSLVVNVHAGGTAAGIMAEPPSDYTTVTFDAVSCWVPSLAAQSKSFSLSPSSLGSMVGLKSGKEQKQEDMRQVGAPVGPGS